MIVYLVLFKPCNSSMIHRTVTWFARNWIWISVVRSIRVRSYVAIITVVCIINQKRRCGTDSNESDSLI